MADIKFTCPHCQQEIQSDQLWCGHQINCPTCQGEMVVPQLDAPSAAPDPTPHISPLVPRPPASQARLSAGRTQVARASSGIGTPQKGFQPRPQKQSSPLLKYALIAVGLAALGVGGYYGYNYWTQTKEDFNAKADKAAKRPVVGETGQAMDVNDALNQPDPNRPAPPRRAALKRKLTGADAGQGVAVAGDSGAAAADSGGADGASTTTTPSPDKQLPVVAPVYTLDPAQAKIPQGKVNGVISGTNFLCETARLDKGVGYYALTLRQGTGLTPDRAVRVFLRLKPNEGPTNQTFTSSPEARDPAITSVVKLWKTNPRYAATEQKFATGYALKLELGLMADNNTIPGKIFLALPDPDKTVVGGQFTAALVIPDPSTQLAAPVTPARTPPMNPAAANAYRQRYGAPRRP